jgi:hypothetical protein
MSEVGACPSALRDARLATAFEGLAATNVPRRGRFMLERGREGMGIMGS